MGELSPKGGRVGIQEEMDAHCTIKFIRQSAMSTAKHQSADD